MNTTENNPSTRTKLYLNKTCYYLIYSKFYTIGTHFTFAFGGACLARFHTIQRLMSDVYTLSVQAKMYRNRSRYLVELDHLKGIGTYNYNVHLFIQHESEYGCLLLCREKPTEYILMKH